MHAEDLREAEVGGPLPELVVLGGRVRYEVVYNDAGVPDGAVRFTDPAVVEGWERYVKRLHDAGEGIQSYYARCVAGLPAPEPA